VPVAPGKHDQASPDDLRARGRVFIADQLVSVDGAPWLNDLELASARLSLDWRRGKRLRVVVELEAKGKAKIKDAFVRLDGPAHLRVQAGNFKMPPSAAERESSWTLPTAGRGILHDILDDGLALTGRAPGVELRWAPKLALGPELTVAAFQGRGPEGDPAPGLLADDGGGMTVAGRLELEVAHDVKVGLWGGSRSIALGTTERDRFWSSGVDLAAEWRFSAARVQLWVDLLAASSSKDPSPIDTPRPILLAGRVILGVPFFPGAGHDLFIEPYAMADLVDPSRDDQDDRVSELVLGVGTGKWQTWRLQVQVELQSAGIRTPLALDGNPDRPVDTRRVTVQLGAAF
jgi:hypothetical protein